MRFELTNGLHRYPLSRRAPSTTQPPFRMPQAKIDRKLHAKFIAKIDDEIRSGVTRILRKKFRDNSSAVKVICRDTGAALRAARNWV